MGPSSQVGPFRGREWQAWCMHRAVTGPGSPHTSSAGWAPAPCLNIPINSQAQELREGLASFAF